MKLISDKALLYEAIQPSLLAVSAKNTNTAIEGLLLEATDELGILQICGYDLEKGIKNTLNVEVQESGSVVVSAQKFSSIVRSMPDGRIEIEVDSRCMMKITGASSEFEIHCMPAESYPALPELQEERSVSCPPQTLKSMLTRCIFSAGYIESRPILSGVCFTCKDNTLQVVALDGYRLALRFTDEDVQLGGEIRPGDELKFVVPVKSLTELIKLIGSMDSDEKVITLSLARRHVVVRLGDVVFFSRLLEGEYIEWQNSIPKNITTTAVVPVEALRDGVDRAALLCTDKIRSPVVFMFADNNLDLTCTTVSGRVHDQFEIKYTGEPMKIGFNHRYLLDVLGACGVDNIKIDLSSSLTGIIISPDGTDEKEHFMYMVLPVRMKE